jgi:hypothetical protein
MREDAETLEVKREPICGYCGHGGSLHVGDAHMGRASGWCLACDERRATEAAASHIPMCWWFAE